MYILVGEFFLLLCVKVKMYKAKLQELCHQRKWGLPRHFAMKDGPDHIPSFKLLIMSIVSPSLLVPLVPLKKLITKLPCLLSSASLLVLHKFPFLGSVCFHGKLLSLVFSSCWGWWSWGWELRFCEVSYVFYSLNCL